jgi:hypothetical protein
MARRSKNFSARMINSSRPSSEALPRTARTLVNDSRLKRFEDPLAISSLANEKYPKAAGA